MKIKFLGHAGFQIIFKNSTLLIDPWLTNNGAFDFSWFQYPCNHHLWDEIILESKDFERLF